MELLLELLTGFVHVTEQSSGNLDDNSGLQYKETLAEDFAQSIGSSLNSCTGFGCINFETALNSDEF